MDDVMQSVFGESDTDDEGQEDPSSVAQQVIAMEEEESKWQRIEQVAGLSVCRNFLTDLEQDDLLRAIYEENCFGDPTQNQAMRFGDLPWWASSLSDKIKERLVTASGSECERGPIPTDILEREPLFDQMIVNSYQPGEGIKAHVDLLRFEDGIAIVSLLSACVMCFNECEGGRDGGQQQVPVLLMPGDLVVMAGEARYKWSHEINRAEGHQVWQGQHIRQDRRISVTLRRLCRN